MNPADIVRAYFAAGEQGDWATFTNSLADDFEFSSASVTQNRTQLVSSTKALWAAFPDLKFNIQVDEVQGDVVKGTYRITGTHTGVLIPPVAGRFVTIEPTGKRISLPAASIELTVKNGKIIKQHNEPKPESGWPGILEQLGVQNPYG